MKWTLIGLRADLGTDGGWEFQLGKKPWHGQHQIPMREERILREVLEDNSIEGSDKSTRIGETIDELGLEPYSAPSPLPPVKIDEVRLVCWMAVQPDQEDSTINVGE